MKVTRKACYGLRALSYIASQPVGKYVSIEEIGRTQGIPEGFLAKLLNELVRGGLLASRRGQEGGLALLRPPSEITLMDVIQVLQGPVAINECVGSHPVCPWSETCTMRKVWQDLQAAIEAKLGSVSLARPPAENLFAQETRSG